MRWKSRNRRTLIVVILLLLFAGFLVTTLAGYYVSREAIRAGIVHTELPMTADIVYSEIQKELIRPVLVSQMMADDTFLRDWVIHKERDVDKITKYLAQVKQRFNAVTSFFVSEQSRVYYYAEGILKKVKESEWRDAWYFRVREMKKPYEINVDIDMANHDAMTVFINYRVYDYKSRFLGTTGVGLTVDSVKKLIDKYQMKYHQRIFFLNHEGHVILSGGKDDWPQKDIRKVEGLSGLADQILGAVKGSFAYRSDGHTKFLNVRQIQEFGWHLCVEKDEEEAIQSIQRVLYLNLAIFVAVSAVFLFLVGMVANNFQSQLEAMAITDKLTGLHNRQAFDVLVENLLERSRRTSATFSAAIMDIDDFKKVNDTFGHLIGDQVLKEVARVAKERVRGADVLCRWGGEEFLLVLPDCSIADALKLVEEIRIAVSENQISANDAPIKTTISAGLAELVPGESVDQLINRADQALYKAKNSGKNRSAIADNH